MALLFCHLNHTFSLTEADLVRRGEESFSSLRCLTNQKSVSPVEGRFPGGKSGRIAGSRFVIARRDVGKNESLIGIVGLKHPFLLFLTNVPKTRQSVLARQLGQSSVKTNGGRKWKEPVVPRDDWLTREKSKSCKMGVSLIPLLLRDLFGCARSLNPSLRNKICSFLF